MNTVLKRAALALPLLATVTALTACGGEDEEQQYTHQFEGATIVHLEDSLQEMEELWLDGTDTQAEPAEVGDDAHCFYQVEKDPQGERRELHGQVICGPITPEGASEPIWEESDWFRTFDPGDGEGWSVYAETFRDADDPVVEEGFDPWRPDGKEPSGL